MAKAEAGDVERLESELNAARIKRMRAEREMTTLQRQAGFVDAPRKLRSGLDRAEQRLEKCVQTEADLVQRIDDLKNPQPEAEAETAVSEELSAQAEAAEEGSATQSEGAEGDAAPEESGVGGPAA